MPKGEPERASVKNQAAALIAEGRMMRKDIAAEVEVTPETLSRWCQEPEFRALIKKHGEQITAGIVEYGISQKGARIAVLQDMHDRLLSIIEARAAAEQRRANDFGGIGVAPGGSSGLLLRKMKSIGFGESAQVVTEYAVDTETVKEIRSIHERVAKELGQEGDVPLDKKDPLDSLVELFDAKNAELESEESETVN